MITIEPEVFYGVIGSAITMIAGALAVWLKTNASSNAYVTKSRADVSVTQEQTSANVTNAMTEIAKQGVAAQQTMIEVVRENTRAFVEYSATQRGMMVMFDDHAKALKNAVIGIDDITGQIPKITSSLFKIEGFTTTLETNLGESINDQFGPVVEELKTIGISIADLGARFQKAEAWLMKTLEPVVIAHMKEILSTETPAPASVITVSTQPIEEAKPIQEKSHEAS